MPIYEYTCESCGSTEELLCKLDDKPKCPECGAEMRREVSAPNFIIHGYSEGNGYA
jgi:putative FmdB family regulatory protein